MSSSSFLYILLISSLFSATLIMGQSSGGEEEEEEEVPEPDPLYPKCWLRQGECLDDNVGPLVRGGGKPQINQNVLQVINETFTLDDCVEHCHKNEDCR